MADNGTAVTKLASRFGWLIVVCAALSLSTWSLYWIGRHFGIPAVVAGMVSACFDGAALICADLALRYARTYGDSGLGPRLGVFVFAGLSAYLNSQHAVLAGNPFAARFLYAAPPVIAVVVFELSTRWSRRGAMRAAGRVPAALPVFDKWAWVLFPFRTIKTIKRIVSVRLDRAEADAGFGRNRNATANADGDRASNLRPVSSVSSSRPGSKKGLSRAARKTRKVRAWARMQGMQVALTGPLSAEVVAAYDAAMGSPNGHVPPSDLTVYARTEG